jgi:hypothetical protein
MPLGQHCPRRRRQRIILPVEDGGDVLSGDAMQMEIKPGRQFALASAG